MVVCDHRALMDIRARVPQPYDGLQRPSQKTGSKRVGLPCCAITLLYLRNPGVWKVQLSSSLMAPWVHPFFDVPVLF